MTFTLDAIRNCAITITALPHASRLEAAVLGKPPNHARVGTPNLYGLSRRSWSRNLEGINRIAVRPSARTFQLAEHSKPYTHEFPCVPTCRQHKDGKEPHRSVIARCEMEWKGCSPEQTPEPEERKCKQAHSDHTPGHEERIYNQAHSDHTPGHEEQKGNHAHSDHTPGGEGCDGELREWRGLKDARHERIKMEPEPEWQNEEDPRREYTPRHCGGDDRGRVSSTLSVADKGYVLKVSKELMGLFCYIEKRKRTMIKELAYTLRQVPPHVLTGLQLLVFAGQIAAVSVVITCIRGVFAPLVEVFKTTPPTWSKLLLMLVSFDSIAVCYLAIKSAEPLEQLAAITTENRRDIMESVEKEEEMILKIAIEFIRLFKRLRNIAISITVSQSAQLVFTILRMKDPNFVGNCLRVVQTWLQAPWT